MCSRGAGKWVIQVLVLSPHAAPPGAACGHRGAWAPRQHPASMTLRGMMLFCLHWSWGLLAAPSKYMDLLRLKDQNVQLVSGLSPRPHGSLGCSYSQAGPGLS